MELGWDRTPAKSIDTAGRLDPPLVTETDHAWSIFTSPAANTGLEQTDGCRLCGFI